MQEPAAHGLIPHGMPSITTCGFPLRAYESSSSVRARVGKQDRRMRPPGRPSALGTGAACQLGICDDQVLCAVPLLCQRDRDNDVMGDGAQEQALSVWKHSKSSL